MAPPSAWIVGVALIALGVVAVGYQRRRFQGIDRSDEAIRSFLRRQVRRRMRTGLLLCVLGAVMVGAHWIDPARRPTAFVLTWTAALLLTLWILWLGIVDFFAVRLHWVARTQRNLADIARTRAELRARRSHEGNGRPPS